MLNFSSTVPCTAQHASLLLLVGLGCVVLWGLTSPISKLPTWAQTHDKVWHLLVFVMFAILASISWPEVHPLFLLLSLVLVGFASEVVQGLTPYRRFCWRDGIADAIGAALGIGLVALTHHVT